MSGWIDSEIHLRFVTRPHAERVMEQKRQGCRERSHLSSRLTGVSTAAGGERRFAGVRRFVGLASAVIDLVLNED